MRRHLTALAATAALLLAGCGDQPQPDGPPSAVDAGVGHIHGLGIDPADDTLYVATHFGLFHVDGRGEAARVADRWQDTMAFTVVGPGHFLASGHPDQREDLPSHLGLIESTDAGESWSALALQGEADFHVLEQVGEVLYAYDATSGRLLSTRDRTDFDEVLSAPLISVTSDPTGTDRLVATTGQGELIAIDAAAGTTTELGGPTTVLLDTTADGSLVGIDPAGVVRISADGTRWRDAGTIGGPPAALTIDGDDWYAATVDRVFRSEDEGSSWDRVL